MVCSYNRLFGRGCRSHLHWSSSARRMIRTAWPLKMGPIFWLGVGNQLPTYAV